MQLDLGKDKRFLQFKKLLEDLEKDYGLDKKEIIQIAEGYSIPISIFDKKISSFEAIVKYLLEEKQIRQKNIAEITGRSKQSIYQAYNSAKKKHPEKFSVDESRYDFPVSIIKQSSVLASIVKYLREEHSLSYKEIGRLLHRDQRTVWTVYNRK